ncbi:RRP15-like protein [Quillaja saponaria]|uniref:RRP15-like protein n=1 Tax=Quillaja saponaria TaxID=32244 RepID=A0AAD7PRX8_QUISA|nr:RRP15-like protein [Quillaja saponaria]
MAEETHLQESTEGPRKRTLGKKKGQKNSRKKPKMFPSLHADKKVKIDKKMKKLFRKRAREYDSDDDDDDDDDAGGGEAAAIGIVDTGTQLPINNKNNKEEDEENIEESVEEAGGDKVLNVDVGHSYDGILGEGVEEGDEEEEDEEEEEEDGEIQPGITKFTEGCRAFRMAFMNIIKKSVSDDSLGPVLSGHKKLVVEKLAEEEAERKIKGETKKEKHLIGEKGHVKPATYLDSHEKFLISVATKGVVKLFNAVNMAQVTHKGYDASRSKDAKVIKKRTKEAFFSELHKPSLSGSATSTMGHTRTDYVEGEGPAWAPLRDNYMLTNPKLKDWDKMPDDAAVSDDIGKMSEDSGSDDD